ncbi:SAFB-like transcription modulator [Bactrocera neohumeralis]|uniref:SAFB-like transcription modulator n=1 Tax=Bactrocera neohumeralis TaxID=98809 RepID=UPI00216515E3|nr:SAFB-like transcription modulator [Bactrocera neohumeralis]
MWENEVQVKSFEDETEVADHILEDDAKTQKEDFTTSQKYIKEKCTDAEGDNTGRNSAPKSTKTVAALKDTRTSKGGSSSIKDERQCSKPDDDKSKRKDEKSGDKKDKDISEQKSSSNKTSQKDDKVNTSTKLSSKGKQTKPSRNLLVSGLSSLTRASDLKTIFSKYGKVIGAKVVTNSRTPGTRCYGYVTMSSSSDTSRSVAKRRVDTAKKDEDKKIRDTTSKTRDDKQTIDTKEDASKKPEVEKDKQRDKEILFQDHNKKDVSKTIEIAEIDPVGKADVVTTIWELLIPWQLALTNETSITICGWKSLLSPRRMFKNEHGSHFGKMWENEVQVKSFEDETEVADHILEDDAKTQKEDFTTSQKYIKEKCTDAEGDNTGRNSAPKSTKTVAALKDTRTSKGGSSSIKDERQCSKPDDDKSKRKDEKSGDKKDKDISEQKSSSNKTSQKDDKVNTSTKLSSKGKQTKPSRNLLVSGLSSLTRASDLKTIFSKYGKVIGAKVVTNSRTPGTRCYGYVTMSSSSDTSRSVAKRRVDTTKKDEDKKIRDTTSKTRDDKQTIDTKDDASKKPEVEKDKQRDKEILFQDHNKKDVSKTIEIAEIDPVGKADVVTTIWELLIPWQLALTNETSITICGWKSLLSPRRMFKNEHGKALKKAKIEENIKILEKYQKEFDTNHENLMADGIGEEDYFKKNEYNNTMIKIEEAINALKMSILKDKPLVEFDRQIETVQIRCTNPDQKTSILMRKIENLRRKMEDLSMELTIDNDQIKGLDCLFNDIQNLKSKLDFNVEIEDIFEKICDEYYEDLQNLKRKLKKKSLKFLFALTLKKEK